MTAEELSVSDSSMSGQTPPPPPPRVEQTAVLLSPVLQELRINHCIINEPILGTLCEAFKESSSIKTLDLAYNNISDKLGKYIIRMIKDQAELRDSLKW